jgi:heat shock protein HslJ
VSRFHAAALAVSLTAAVFSLAGCSSTFGGGAQLDGTRWLLTGWSVSSLDPVDFAITAQFEDGQIGGHAPVNSYGGSYRASSGGVFSTKDVARTLMAGPEPAMRAEDAYFELLEKAERYVLDGDQLTLVDARGNQLLVFGPRP